MNKDVLRKIILDSVIQVISSEIAERIRKEISRKKNRMLVIFSGGSCGLGEAVGSLEYLEKEGYDISYVLTESGNQVLGEENIKTLLATDKVYIEGRDHVDNLINDSQILILPTLTANSAAKIANGIGDTVLTRAAAKYILERKAIFASTNSCCPEDRERVMYLNHPINEFYKKQMTANMERIEKFGVVFSFSKNLGKKVSNHINKNLIGQRQSFFSEKMLIARSDIANYPDGIILYTRKGSRFTDMAMELASSKGIRIESK